MGAIHQALLSIAPPAGGGFGAEQPFILTISGGSDFNDTTGCLGFEFTVGGSPIQVTQLGRRRRSGNSGTHEVRLVETGVGFPLVASVNVDCSSGTVGDFIYAAITPVVLSAGVTYIVACKETNGGDLFGWDDSQTITTEADATIDRSVTGTGGASCTGYIQNTSGVKAVGVPNFIYQPSV